MPAGSHVTRVEFNHCFRQQSFSTLLDLAHYTRAHTHARTQFSLVYFVQVKQELGLKSILTQEFMLGDLVRLFFLCVLLLGGLWTVKSSRKI